MGISSSPELLGATSFPSLGDTSDRLRFVPVRPQTPGRRIVPEFAVPVAPGPVVFEELSGSPKFPGNPHDHSPCSPTPVGPDPRERTPCKRIRRGPRIRRRRRLATSRISGFYHTAFGLAVYASQWKLPATTQDSLPVAGPQALPDGIRTRRVPVKGLDHGHLLLSRASWRNFVSFAFFCSKMSPTPFRICHAIKSLFNHGNH
jgi:hypothetical protein